MISEYPLCSYQTAEKIIASVEAAHQLKNKYLSELKAPFDTALVDNEYSNANEKTISNLLVALLGKYLAQDLEYFLYESRDNAKIIVNDVEFQVDTLEKYLDYVKQNYFSKENNT